jgi:surface antigen
MKRSKRLMIIFLVIFHCFNGVCYGNDLVNKAISQLGNGEKGGNNKGEYVQLYNRGLEASWCAGFVSYCLKEVGYDVIGYNLSAKAIFNKARSLGLIVDGEPKSGDLVCFWREKPTSWKGHIGIVEKVDEQYVHTIEGNVGKFPAKVKRFKYEKDNVPKLLGYVRIK